LPALKNTHMEIEKFIEECKNGYKKAELPMKKNIQERNRGVP
jgi:hypothetical protein